MRTDRRVSFVGLSFLILALLLVLNPSTVLAQTLYWGGGNANLPEDTPLPTDTNGLTGTWNNNLENWATSPTPGSYVTFDDGVFANLGSLLTTNASASANIKLESSFDVSGLMANMAAGGAATEHRFNFTSAVPVTLTIPNTGGRFILAANQSALAPRGVEFQTNVSLAGSGPFNLIGSGRLLLRSACTNLTGPLIMQGSLRVGQEGPGSLAGITNISIRYYLTDPNGSSFLPTMLVTAPNTTGVVNQLNDSATFEMVNGILDYVGRSTTSDPTRETIAKLALRSHGLVDLDAHNSATTNMPKLILSDPVAGIDRGPNGRGTLIIKVNSAGNPTNALVVQNGLPTGQLLPWIGSSRAEFMQLDPASSSLVTVASTYAPSNIADWVAGSNYRLGSNNSWISTGSITSDLTLNSLAFFSTSLATVTVDNAATLTLSSGALAMYPSGQNGLILGGKLTTTNSALYVLMADGAANGDLTLNNELSGNMDLVLGGYIRALTMGGSSNNTYAGTTYVNAGVLKANKSGSAISVPGKLVVDSGGIFDAVSGTPISGTSTVQLNRDAVFKCASTMVHGGLLTIDSGLYSLGNGGNPTITGGLAFNGGRIAYNTSGNASFSIQSAVTYSSNATRQALWELFFTNGLNNFSIELDGAPRTFDIAESLTLPAGQAEMVIDARIRDGTPAGGSLVKTGSGTLKLTETNSYTGGTVVNQGVLEVSAVRAPARNGLFASTTPGGAFSRVLTFNQPIANTLVSRQTIGSTLLGTNVIRTNTVVLFSLNDFQICSGNNGFFATTNLTDLTLDAVWRGGTLGVGPVTINGGSLVVDYDITVTNHATLGGGTLMVNGSFSGILTMTNGTLSGTGTVSRSTTIIGRLAPGTPIGTLQFSSNIIADSSSALALELGASGNDRVVVGGTATLGGTLEVVNVDAVLAEGASFTAMTAAVALTGVFAATNLPGLDPGLAWQVTYGANDLVLEVVADGGGSEPVLGVSPASFDFGAVLVGLSNQVSLVVTNSGTALLNGTATVSGISFTTGGGEVFSVPVAGSTNVVITFAPALAESYAGNVVFLSDGGGSTSTLAGYGYIIAVATNGSILRTNGAVQFGFAVLSGATYRVEASSNLLDGAGWTLLEGPLTNRGAGAVLFSDTNATLPNRIYRVISP